MISEEQHNELRKRFSPDGSILRRTQLRLLEMLKFFDSVCKQHNIKYWLSSGSLLGAVRHGAFIPWDDDLDVEMLEEDYKKMCKVFEGLQHDDFVLQNHNTDPNFFSPYSKIRDKHSFKATPMRGDLRYKYRGIALDIFCLVPSSSGKLVYFTGILQNKLLYNFTKIDNKYLRNVLVKPTHWILSKIIFPPLAYISRVCSDGSIYRHRIGMKFPAPRYKVDLFPLTKVKLEGYEFPAPGNYDHYLSAMFGDYMRLPEIKELEEQEKNIDAMKIKFDD